MEKQQLVNFIAKVMEESGFKVYKEFKTSQMTIDIYGVLPTVMGDFGVVVACKNYDKQWEVGVDVLKEMEMVGRNLKASKVAIISSSTFSSQARNYASRKNIKLIDRDNLMVLAKKFSKTRNNNHSNDYHYDDGYFGNGSVDDVIGGSFDFFDEYGDDSIYPDNYGDYNQSYSSYGYDEDIYRDDTTYMSGKSSTGLGRQGSEHSTGNYPVPTNRGSGLIHIPPKKQGPPLFERIKPILNNTIVLILLVVAVSYTISTIIGLISGASNGGTGLIKILSSLALSYGLVLFLDRDGTTVLVKGTTVFFVSLVILIIMIIVL